MTNSGADRLLGACLRTYPRAQRERDGEVLLSLARELSDGGSSRWREAVGLVRGGMAERLRLRCRGLFDAPWRAALAKLALPLAAVHLAVWIAGVGSIDPLPLGKWWTLVLGGSLFAVIGAALRWRLVATVGALGVLVALAHAGYEGFFQPITAGSAHFRASFGGAQTDLDSVMLPAAVVLVSASLTLPRRPVLSTRALVALLGAVAPAVGLWLFTLSGGPSSMELGGVLVGALFVLAAACVIWSTLRRRQDPVGATLGATVLAIAAPAGPLLLPNLLPYGGAADAVGTVVFVAGWVIAPIAFLALVGRGHPASTPE